MEALINLHIKKFPKVIGMTTQLDFIIRRLKKIHRLKKMANVLSICMAMG